MAQKEVKEREVTPKAAAQTNVEAETEMVSKAMEIVEMAKSEIASHRNEPDTPMLGADPVDSFKGLPMRELIGGPLIAAAEAQEKLAATAWEFYQKIAFEADDKGNPKKEARILEFEVERPIEQGGEMKAMKQKVKAPFIGLVPIPSLLIDNISVDFEMEVKDNNVSKSKTDSTVDTKVTFKKFLFPLSAEISGKVTTSRENTRTTDKTAKYTVRVHASQQQPTEGLSKLMDIMASCIEPLPVNTTPAP